MHFPKHWAKGVWRGRDRFGAAITREAWAWSDVSEGDAHTRARERARRSAETTGSVPSEGSGDDYPYPRGPLREPVLRTLPTGSTEVRAVITRNSYGCDVLNTDRAVFIDVDLPPPERPGMFAVFFGRRNQSEDVRIDKEAAKIALLEQWQRARLHLMDIGTAPVAASVAPIVDAHDCATRAASIPAARVSATLRCRKLPFSGFR